MHFWELEENKKLIKKWRGILKKKGFKDIESFNEILNVPSFRVAQKYKRDHEEYFRLALQWLVKGKFKNKEEKKAWKLHCDGQSSHKIAAYFNTHKIKIKNKPANHLKILRIIKRIEKEMLNAQL